MFSPATRLIEPPRHDSRRRHASRRCRREPPCHSPAPPPTTPSFAEQEDASCALIFRHVDATHDAPAYFTTPIAAPLMLMRAAAFSRCWQCAPAAADAIAAPDAAAPI